MDFSGLLPGGQGLSNQDPARAPEVEVKNVTATTCELHRGIAWLAYFLKPNATATAEITLTSDPAVAATSTTAGLYVTFARPADFNGLVDCVLNKILWQILFLNNRTHLNGYRDKAYK